MKNTGKTFLTGLATIVPVTVTLYFIYWLTISAENSLGKLFRYLLPDGWYVPGIGLLTGLILVFFVGVLMHAYIVKKLYAMGERLMYRIPLIRSVYGSIRDLFNLFSRDQEDTLNQAVIFKQGEIQMIGFITRQNVDDLIPESNTNDNVAVYLPMSYMIGGYMVIVPRSSLQPLNMPVEDVMRIAITAGITRTYQ